MTDLMAGLPNAELYFTHDEVFSDIPAKDPASELAIFETLIGPSPLEGTVTEKLIERVTEFATQHNFLVWVATPNSVDEFMWWAGGQAGKRVLVIYPPGIYYHTDFRYLLSASYAMLWVYGIPEVGIRPRLLFARKRQSSTDPTKPGGMIGYWWGNRPGQPFLCENIEVAGFGSGIEQNGMGDFLSRGCFFHSMGGRAMFRSPGCERSELHASTYLIDSEFRCSGTSHTVYLDWGKRTVIMGSKFSRQQIVSHALKNETAKTSRVENNILASGIDGVRGREYTNPWVTDFGLQYGYNERGGSTPYDGLPTEFLMFRNNQVIHIGGNGALLSAQTRGAACGNNPCYPVPEIGYLYQQVQHYNVCDGLRPPETPPSEMWTDAYWDAHQTKKNYWIDNDLSLGSNPAYAVNMIGITITADTPGEYEPTTGGTRKFSISQSWNDWLASKLDGRVTYEHFFRGNTFPPGLGDNIGNSPEYNYHYNYVVDYGQAKPTEADVFHHVDEFFDLPDPEEIDWMLRPWNAAEFIAYTIDGDGLPQSLRAVETGTDTLFMYIEQSEPNRLFAQESGADTAVFAGTHENNLSARESGSDVVALTGDVLINGGFAVTELLTDSLTISSPGALLDQPLFQPHYILDLLQFIPSYGLVAEFGYGSLVGVESGTDSIGLTGDVLVAGDFAFAETGSDTATLSAFTPVAGVMVLADTGSDDLAVDGSVRSAGSLVASDSGPDVLSLAGATIVSGSLVLDEAGFDEIVGQGALEVAGDGFFIESGTDTALLSATAFVVAHVQVQESGTDSASLTGEVQVVGDLSMSETSRDGMSMIGSVPVVGDFLFEESGSDAASLSGAVLVNGALLGKSVGKDALFMIMLGTGNARLEAIEAGLDAATLGGSVPISGYMALQSEPVQTGGDQIEIRSTKHFILDVIPFDLSLRRVYTTSVEA